MCFLVNNRSMPCFFVGSFTVGCVVVASCCLARVGRLNQLNQCMGRDEVVFYLLHFFGGRLDVF